MPALRLLIKHGGDPYPVAEAITDYKMNSFIDPEMALCSLNTIARKAETVSRGSVSHACILASEAVRDRAIYRRAAKVYEMMKDGKIRRGSCTDPWMMRGKLQSKRGVLLYYQVLPVIKSR